jgi:glycosyltransferase involved in cell wall biosynthesis
MSNTFLIIVTYNGLNWLSKCLESTKPYPVIVVDNNSTDGTTEFIKLNFPKTIILKQSKNLGFGKANNIGIEYALSKGCDYVFLLNQDAYLGKNCIPELINIHKKSPEFGILSPIHLNGEGSRLDKMFSNYLGYGGNCDFYSDFILKRKKRVIYEVPFVNAAGWLLSKACLETVGGFDPLFVHYGEDENYCQRTHYFNFKIGVVPETFIYHDREDRLLAQEIKGNTEHFKRMEKEMKVEFGDINKTYDNKLRAVMRRRAFSKFKSYLKFNIKDARYYKQEYNMLKRIIPKIEESREKNKNVKAPHLNIPHL